MSVRIVINDVESLIDLNNAISAVLTLFTNDPDKFAGEEEVFSKSACECADCETEIATVPAQVGPFKPCADRGRHLRLTDCALCWADVHRGIALETDVLSDAAWDLGVVDLTLRAVGGRHRAESPVRTDDDRYVGRHRASSSHEVTISDGVEDEAA